MSLGRRLALVVGSVVVAVVITSAVLSAVLARSSLEGSVDEALEAQADGFAGRIAAGILQTGVETPPPRELAGSQLSEAVTRIQIVNDDGTIVFRSAPIPIDAELLAEALDGDDVYRTIDIDDRPFRVLTRPVDETSVMQLATTVESLEDGLGDLRRALMIVGVVGVAVAAVIALVTARRLTQPIVDVTEAAGRLVHERALPEHIETDRNDEVGRMADAFNELVDALKLSREQQDRLVADASHELRTPLTSLRMKIEFMESQPDLPDAQRQSVVAGAAAELEVLTALVGELVDLASNGAVDEAVQPIVLGDLVQEIAARARLTTDRTIAVSADTAEIQVRPGPVRRALSNLVDNAHKYSPKGHADRDLADRSIGRGPRPRRWHAGRDPRPCLRPVLPRPRGPDGARQRDRPGHRQAGGRPPRRPRLDRRRRRRGHRRGVLAGSSSRLRPLSTGFRRSAVRRGTSLAGGRPMKTASLVSGRNEPKRNRFGRPGCAYPLRSLRTVQVRLRGTSAGPSIVVLITPTPNVWKRGNVSTASAITTRGLTKRFGDLTAVDDITIDVPVGGVVGFVGPNGSGKSTLIRTLLGLIAPTDGDATVLGQSITRPERYADRVGALIENPAFVASLTARDNLRSLALHRGLPLSRVDEVLATVGLTGRDNDKAGTYSLGMKQRLGIAAALLPDPELLMLDEPTNGLDPAGIVEIRRLLRTLAAEGRTSWCHRTC